jgi:hypothetical protein
MVNFVADLPVASERFSGVTRLVKNGVEKRNSSPQSTVPAAASFLRSTTRFAVFFVGDRRPERSWQETGPQMKGVSPHEIARAISMCPMKAQPRSGHAAESGHPGTGRP